MSIEKYLTDLMEARDPRFEYKSFKKGGRKETSDKSEIDKVVVYLEKQKSTACSKLSDKFQVILEAQKVLDKQMEELKETARERVEDLFDATDEVYTRVADTASVLLTLSKKTFRNDVKFDKENFYKDLLAIVPELKVKIDELDKKYTEIKTTEVKSKLNVKLKDNESNVTVEGVVDTVKNIWNKVKESLSKFKSYIINWGKGYDKKLDDIQTKYFDVGSTRFFSSAK